MSGDPVTLTPDARQIVEHAIEVLCAERSWMLLARNALATHVHVVVNCRGTVSPERALTQFKARGTRDLRIEKLAVPDAVVWTEHGSTRWINHYPGLYGAIAYTNDWQSGPNREMLEEHKRLVRERLQALKAWLKANGLPSTGDATDEPRTK